jgi:serine/threonine protein kinase/Tfp pilus assembly protein PilF
MKNSDGLSSAPASATQNPERCAKCGATTRLESGVCVSCLLGEGLEAGVSRAAFESVMAEADVPDTQWHLGNYEVLDEIARGGMGVIYRARQRHSRRIVAIKRVLSYQADSHETLIRFRREAEAAASLDHPNVLPIYEVSESEDGLPFFSMKFAAGGSLRDCASSLRNEPRKCVQLMAKVARAVEYAHGRGVLHRDLKPGNILIDEHGEPLVSDFGLAKWLSANTDLTKSLTTFGTAGYIAPEQAEGAAADLTPAADVYSLGAILFELLTGRPPFVGDNALSVIRQASEKPAPKLRSLSRGGGIDRDLETICARCLERDPKARYRSAGDLATDLERWLKGLLIIARPVSPPTRIWRWSRRNPKLVATGVAGLFLGAAAIWFFRGEQAGTSRPPIGSIAVLPFENLSGNPDNAYFANGIQEEILTRLAGIAELKVISRTSTQHYQSKPRNLRQIAKQLRVANILEGSVQKAADQVRVNVQLINAETDSHLWAETFDRKLNDILGVESEIAKRIAESLQANLTSREEQALDLKPTTNSKAYDAYLRGLSFETRSRFSVDTQRKAAEFYERAVRVDPNFSLAWARLCRADALIYFNHADDSYAERGAEAKRALENAQRLEPNSPQTQLASGYYQYQVLVDYGAAKATLGRLSKMLPANSQVLFALGAVTRREGHWDESIAYLEQAAALDPGNVNFLTDAAWTHAMLRQFPAAVKFYDRALDITPYDPDVIAKKASIYQAQGNLQEAARLLSEINLLTLSEQGFAIKIAQLKLERNYTEAVRLLRARLAEFHYTSEFFKTYDLVALALTQRLAGDIAGATATAEQARQEFEELYHKQPDNFVFGANLSQAYAAIGKKESALRAAERAIMLLRPDKDRVNGPTLQHNLALIQTIFGDNNRAISTLTQLLKTPYNCSGWLHGPMPVTPALLRLDPFWDSLRADPAFQKLCEEKQ